MQRSDATHLTSTVRLYAVHDTEQNARILLACVQNRTVHNRTIEHLLAHRSDEPLQKNTAAGVTGLYGFWTAWRAEEPALQEIHGLVARGAIAGAADQVAKWEATNHEHAVLIAQAAADGKPIYRVDSQEEAMEDDREWRRLERTIGAGPKAARCIVVYEGPDDQRETTARMAEELGATESVAIDSETTTMVELGKRLGEVPGNGPVQVTGIEKWPGGVGDFGEQLNRSLPRLTEECPRTVLIWARDQELNGMLKAGGDLHGRIEGSFDMRPQERERGQPNAPAPPVRPHIDTTAGAARQTGRGPER